MRYPRQRIAFSPKLSSALVAVRELVRSPRWAVPLIALAIVALVTGQAWYVIWTDRTTTLDQAARDMTNLSVVLGQYTAQSIKSIDVGLTLVQREVKRTGVNSAEAFRASRLLPSDHAELLQAAEDLPKPSAIILFDSKGNVLDTSRGPVVPPVTASDRDFFVHFRDHDDPGLYISTPVLGRITGARVVFLARRINGPSGQFLGIVAATLDIQQLRDFYRASNVGGSQGITVLRRDGVVIARYPDPTNAIGTAMPPQSPWYRMVAKGGGTYQSPGFFGAAPSIVAVHPLDNYPLVVDIIVSKAEILAPWRGRAVQQGVEAFVVIFGFLLLLRLIERQFQSKNEQSRYLALSEERFRTLVAATTQIVWITNAAGETIEDSSGSRAYTGQNYDEMAGYGWLNAIHPDDAMRARKDWDQAVASKAMFHSEYRLRGRDGKYREFLSTGVPIMDPDGTVREWVGTCKDVTDRNQLDAALRQSRERLALATESARMGIWDWDVTANRLIWDARMYELYGIREQDFNGAYSAWQAGLHPDDLARGNAAITAAIERVSDFHIEFRVVWPNGEVHDIEARALLQGPPTGRATRMVGTNWDITERKRAAATIALLADQYETMLATTSDGFYLIDQSGRFLSVSDAYCRMTGYSRDELMTFHISDVEVTESADATRGHKEAIRNSGFDRFETTHRRKDGGSVDIENSVSFWRASGEFLCFARDITDRKRAEQKLRASEVKFRDLFDATKDAIILFNPSSRRFVSANSSAVTLFGAKDEVELLSGVPLLLSPERQLDGRHSGEKARDMFATALRDGTLSLEWACRRLTGTEFLADVLLTAVTHGNDAVIYCTIRDITERKRAEAQITRLARQDNLTGLANRTVFVEALEQALARAHRGGASFAVLYLDLDHFKDINDTLGHRAGDLVLHAVAERLRASVRDVDTVARFGGDEFAILLNDIGKPENAALVSGRILRAVSELPGIEQEVAAVAAAVAEKIMRGVTEPIAVPTSQVHTGTSIGIAVYEPDGSDAETLLSRADVALYRAKAEQRGSYCFFSDRMSTEIRAKVDLTNELRAAIAGEQFFLMYQPQVDIDTGRIVGIEALVRWQHPTRGVVGPGHFIPDSESNGLIVPLGHWVMNEACRQAGRWLDAGIALPLVSINLSGIQFKRPLDLERDIEAAAGDAGLPPRRLELELTESVLMAASHGYDDLLVRLRKRGYRVAIDDFGSGYSSLDYLRRYPVDRIKIAQTFITDIGIEPGNDAIVKAALGLARELGIEVVVEGVETFVQLQLLKVWGCKIVQGYYFSRPLLVADTTGLLRAGKVTAASAGAQDHTAG